MESYSDTEDDALLQPKSKEIRKREEPPPPAEALLALRQKLKKTKANMVRVESHLEFIHHCVTNKITPRGLKINVNCHALLKSYSKVEEKFSNTTNRAQEEYSQNLLAHYNEVKEQ